jgi:outer membrane usher protein
MRPGFVTMPQLTLAGEAALPSTVEVLVNNARRVSQQVQPGPFELTNVPVITGAGELNRVVRDLLGRETIVQQSYYASPRLLAPGLADFSFEAGWLRTGYGQDGTTGGALLTGRITSDSYIFDHPVYSRLRGGQNALRVGTFTGSLTMEITYSP